VHGTLFDVFGQKIVVTGWFCLHGKEGAGNFFFGVFFVYALLCFYLFDVDVIKSHGRF